MQENDLQAEKLFHIVGEKSRMKIIKACFNSDRTTTELMAETGLEKTLLSKHIKVLRKSKVLLAHKKGRTMTYRINKILCHKTRQHTLSLFCCNIELK